jgi:hypothetical protein
MFLHGAAKDSWFVHLAITSGESEWFGPVADAEYNEANQPSMQGGSK